MAAPANLVDLIGTEDYYKERDGDFVKRHAGAPPSPDYYLQYGLRYFRQFVALRDKLSDQGREWVDRTARGLQKAIEDRRQGDPLSFDALECDSPAFRRFAFATHPEAYLAGGLGQLPAEDILLVVSTPDRRDLLSRPGIEQIVTTAMGVVQTNGIKGNFWFVVHALMALEKHFSSGLEGVDAGLDGVPDSGLEGLRIVDAGKRTVGAIVQDLVNKWVMRQTWQNPLFCSWRVAPEQLRPLVPLPLELDLRDGDAWVSVVPLQMANVGFIKPQLPSLPTFGEVNVRTYVRFGGHSGVYFFSLECGNSMVDFGAQLAFGLPYRQADVAIASGQGGPGVPPSWTCSSQRENAMLECSYQPRGDIAPAAEGSLEQFLTDRLSLFVVDSERQTVQRGDVVHQPWRLQSVDVQIRSNTLLRNLGLAVDRPPDHVAFSEGVDTCTRPFVVVG